MAAVIDDESLRCSKAEAGRRVVERFDERMLAQQYLDLVRRLGVLRTPTTLVLDAAGREITRASGAPRSAQVLAALDGVGA